LPVHPVLNVGSCPKLVSKHLSNSRHLIPETAAS
jgi:hypothetical protein